ncbi:FtsX-like permease family protein [Thiorhodococcus mannitoliphagus]|uniref:FtsX-like permease family protein n=1 Tax=Thiorhodococcus mannitoliphagus TaxID=329406 RepID=A0A6P1DVZ3_9GAMM|nr:FtsX-like permease family protein [Thiorhodococcus mannitoliphagus]NEX22318.1 FtsX-like permease family protein [Thiorhodococcus mannitoliphagus]
MTAWRITLRLLRQDWRSGELYLLSAALVLTVAAITAVGFFTDRVEATMERQGSALIAADLALESSSPLAETLSQEAQSRGLETAQTVEFRSVVTAGQAPQLVQIKAADPGYPLRGALRISDGAGSQDQVSTAGPPPGDLWVESRLLRLLAVDVGDELRVGETGLRIGAILTDEPDKGRNLFNIAPRVLMSHADLPATGLIGPASRATYRLLIAGPAEAVADFKRWVTPRLAANVSLEDALNARPEFASAVDRASRFLRLATLVTLLVAGAAIALASHRLVDRQIDAVAVMRCLGAPRHLLMRVFILRLVVFGLLASLLGCLLGWLGQLGLIAALADWLEPDLPPPSMTPILIGVTTGMIALLGFAVPPLAQLAQVPPLRALRRDLGRPRASAALTLGAAGLALALLVFWQADDFELAWKLLGGVLGALLALVLSVLVLVRLAGGLAGRARGVWRLGLAALARRPSTAVLQISGLGIGILALLLLAVVRVDLLESWQETLPEGAPNYFLINIQPHEVEPLRDFLSSAGIQTPDLYPMIRGRLTHIGEQEIDPSSYEDPRAERLATREFNLSYGEAMQSDNRIVAGRWWSGGDAPPQFSVEQGIAETLGIALGDELTFWISGHAVSGPVTSLREVQWDSFNVNFFVSASPSLLQDEAATFITSFYLPREREAVVTELARRFPSVTTLDVDAILRQVRGVIDRGVLAVEYVFFFTLAAGLLVMYAGIQASLEQRRVEHGILRTLGANRRSLLISLGVEFSVAGLLAGLLASVFAESTGYLLAEQLFELDFSFNPSLWVLGVLGSSALIGLAGTLATYPLLIRPPLRTLRGEG